ncbi:MAG: Arc family DNA-binding protein [Amphiplicatus sp.]|nr:Arc family DNA-binding protein [Amphiplicatus sp.]
MKIRISSDLRRKIEASARANIRTMNSEVVTRLEASFAERLTNRSDPSTDLAQRVAVLEEAAVPDFTTSLRQDEQAQTIEALNVRLTVLEKMVVKLSKRPGSDEASD